MEAGSVQDFQVSSEPLLSKDLQVGLIQMWEIIKGCSGSARTKAVKTSRVCACTNVSGKQSLEVKI